jgi:hypothetical protein
MGKCPVSQSEAGHFLCFVTELFPSFIVFTHGWV